MNFKEQQYEFVYDILKDLGVPILEDINEKEKYDKWVYFQIGTFAEEELSGFMSGDGEMQVLLQYTFNTKKIKDYRKELRKLTGDYYDKINEKVSFLSYPKILTIKDSAGNIKFDYIVRGLKSISVQNDYIEKKEDNFIVLIFDYTKNIYRQL